MAGGVLLDIAGVVSDGEKAVPGAAGAVARLREAGVPVRFVSNTTRAPKRGLAERLARLGVPVEENEIATPAAAARQWLSQNRCTPYLLVHPALEEEFSGLPDHPGRAVVVGDAGEKFTYAALNEAFRDLVAGAKLLALAPNRSFRDADGALSLDAGPFVAALEFAAQCEAVVLGKPSRAFFLSVLEQIGCAPEDAVMVGDDAETDVAGALRAGIGRAFLVRTGKYREGDEARFEPRPTETVGDLAAAVERIVEKG